MELNLTSALAVGTSSRLESTTSTVVRGLLPRDRHSRDVNAPRYAELW